MNKILNKIGLLIGISVCFTSCLDEVEIPGGDPHVYDAIYMAQAYQGTHAIMMSYKNIEQSFVFGANFAGVGYPSQDVNVNFTVDESLVALYNEENNTNYEVLPSGAYIMGQKFVIPAGELVGTPLRATINPIADGLELFKKYLLPISIESTDSDYQINSDLKTTYFVVSASLDFVDFVDFDRSNWSASANSKESAEGNDTYPDNGMPVAAIDGSLDSFWHTRWDGGNDLAPYILTVDMGESVEVNGFATYGRQSSNNGKPKDVVFEVSEDGENWNVVKAITLENINSEQRFFVDVFQRARFFRMITNTTYGGESYTHLAEIYAF